MNSGNYYFGLLNAGSARLPIEYLGVIGLFLEYKKQAKGMSIYHLS
jgi:hypothetical protein